MAQAGLAPPPPLTRGDIAPFIPAALRKHPDVARLLADGPAAAPSPPATPPRVAPPPGARMV